MPILNMIYWATWGGGKWQPWANTIAYYPLTSTTTVNDQSGNNRNLTNSNVSFWTQFGVDCAYISWNADSSHSVSKYLYWNITWLPTWAWARTFLFWVYNNNANISSVADDMYIFQWQASNNKMVFVNWWWVDSRSGLAISQRWSSWSFWVSIRKQRCYNVITYDGTKFEWYVNWVSRWTWTKTINTWSNKFSIFGASENPAWNAFNGWMSKLILENKVRTAQEIQDYYNLTKWNYWL
jgi:hypothetical protein